MPDKPKIETTVTERKVQGDSEENRMAKEIGRRLKPDGHYHVATIAIHVYKPIFGSGVEVRTQNLNGTDDKQATSTEANYAMVIANQVVARSYGWQPNRKQRRSIKPE